jgi:hypothetical protein
VKKERSIHTFTPTQKGNSLFFFFRTRLYSFFFLIDFFFLSITRKQSPPQPSFDFEKKILLFHTSNFMLISGTALDYMELIVIERSTNLVNPSLETDSIERNVISITDA